MDNLIKIIIIIFVIFLLIKYSCNKSTENFVKKIKKKEGKKNTGKKCPKGKVFKNGKCVKKVTGRKLREVIAD